MNDIDISMNGSCWDEGPSMVRPGECDPMPPRCELRAGHLGAHRGGLSEWMRNEHLYNYVAARLREAEAVIAKAHHMIGNHAGDLTGVAMDAWVLLSDYTTTKAEGDRNESGKES